MYRCINVLVKQLSLFILFSYLLSLTELKDDSGWTLFNYYNTFDLNQSLVKDSCERINYHQVDEGMFVEKYERPGRPVVIVGGQLDWHANRKWTSEVSSC